MTGFGIINIVAYEFRKLRLHEMDAAMLKQSISYEISHDEDVQGAIGLASLAHRGQTRPGQNGNTEPYITHPLRNTLRLIRFGCEDTDVLSATALHDTVEDQPERLVELMNGDRTAPGSPESRRTPRTSSW
ncbi:MAG: hypothetical protein WBQ44_23905 [Rhodococcus sp. (in: high G+C Gram-positive bacteria)]